jgi:Trypsin-like peptidase domain
VRRLGAAALAAVLVLVACEDDGPVLPTTTTTTTTTTTPSTSTTSSTSPPTTAAPATSSATTSAPTSTTTTTTTPDTTTTLPPQPADPAAPRLPLRNADGSNDVYSGIGQLQGYGTTCTAFLLDAGEPSGPAYAMTNGHCVGLFDSTTVVRDGTGGDGVVTFRLYQDTPSDHAEVPVTSVLYATMRGTDVAILALGASRRALVGLTAYGLASPPRDGEAIGTVGIPTQGLAEGDRVLRGDTCTAGATARLVEWEWTWDAAQSNDCKGILSGSSGSPVFDARDPSVAVGIVNTTTIGAAPGRNCGLGQPCEITSAGVARQPDRSYAMPVWEWADCFDPAWDPTASGCPIEQAPVAVDAPLRAVQPGGRWAATISAAGAPVAAVVKAGPAATTDCHDPAGYLPAPTPGAFDDALPPAEGVYLLCAAALDGRGTPDTADAGSAVMEVDATPPTDPIQLSKTVTPDFVAVEPVFQPPEYSDFAVKVGPPGSTNCVRTAGYAPYRRTALRVATADLPARLCVSGTDDAGNRGPPQAFDLP